MWPFLSKAAGASGFFSSFTAVDVTLGIDGSGITAIVTGASSGIGKETSRVLALRGLHVNMAARNMAAGRDAKEEIVQKIPSANVDTMELNLASMSSVRQFALEYKFYGLPLNFLV